MFALAVIFHETLWWLVGACAVLVRHLYHAPGWWSLTPVPENVRSSCSSSCVVVPRSLKACELLIDHGATQEPVLSSQIDRFSAVAKSVQTR